MLELLSLAAEIIICSRVRSENRPEHTRTKNLKKLLLPAPSPSATVGNIGVLVGVGGCFSGGAFSRKKGQPVADTQPRKFQHECLKSCRIINNLRDGPTNKKYQADILKALLAALPISSCDSLPGSSSL